MTGQDPVPPSSGPPGPPGRPGRPGRSAPPHAPAPSFDDEIRAAVRYERGLELKGLLAIVLVAVILTLRVLFFG